MVSVQIQTPLNDKNSNEELAFKISIFFKGIYLFSIYLSLHLNCLFILSHMMSVIVFTQIHTELFAFGNSPMQCLNKRMQSLKVICCMFCYEHY